MRKFVLLTILISFFTTVNAASFTLVQGQAVEAPETLEEARGYGEEILKGLPEVIINAFWGMIRWLKNLWNSYIFPFLQNIWQKILNFLGKEIEQRKPGIEEEFKKEKEEMKEEIPKAGKNIWERFKELIK